MPKKDTKEPPGLPTTGPNTIEQTHSPTDPVPDPPRGSAAEHTGQTADTVRRTGNPADDLESEMNNVTANPGRKGALGESDVNLGQDTPVGGGEAEGRNRDDAA